MTETITQLTPEQEALIPVYREKWRSIALSTQPLDLTKASEAIKSAYSLVGKEEPVIIFCSSPYTALNSIIDIMLSSQYYKYMKDLIDLYFDPYFPEMFTFNSKLDPDHLISCISSTIYSYLWSYFEQQYWQKLISKITEIRSQELVEDSDIKLRLRSKHKIKPLNYVGNYMSGKVELWSGSVDFCISVLGINYNPQKWSVIQSLISECGWIFTFEKIAIVCGRPIKIMLDSEDLLHGEGEPAIQFADGFSLYAYHGVRLPEKYGKIRPNQWSQKLIAKEPDIYLKQTLIRASSSNKIAHLTPEQESLIPAIRDKWKNYAFSTESINHDKAEAAVKAAYTAMGEKEPEVLFCDSPLMLFETAAKYAIINDCFPSLWEEIYSIDDHYLRYLEIAPPGSNRFMQHLQYQLIEELQTGVAAQIEWFLEEQLKSELVPENQTIMRSTLHNGTWRARFAAEVWLRLEQSKDKLLKLAELISEDKPVWSYNQEITSHILMTKKFPNCTGYCGYILPEISLNPLSPQPLLEIASFIDFCISVLNLNHNLKKWLVLESLLQNCGSILALKNICVVGNRPRILSFDNQNRLHAEGCPAIQFADGYSIYAYHGVRLPKKYGKYHPNQWRSEWLLSEDNAELRRVLIQGIGYERICQELQATELDNWQEYSLLKIDSHVDVESMYLLKMTCPSTGHIHALQVPPTMESAREAITWVNWGISPEEFSVQT